MTMQGIDISNWQAGLTIASIDPACRFIIVKATQGGSYVSPTMTGQADATLANGRLLGLYHYVDGSGAAAEAAHFAAAVAPYLGRAVLAIDWEAGSNRRWGDTAYLRDVCKAVTDCTGRTPLLYCSASALPAVRPVADALGMRLWVAQYANNNPTGWQEHPWDEGAYTCTVRQYSSAGRVTGYAGRLDLDIAYMDAGEWAALAGSTTPAISTTTAEEEDDMHCIIQINDDPALSYYDGVSLHTLTNPDQVTALNAVYKACTGKDIPMVHLGSKDAPYGTRFVEAIQA
ncbi:glycosyl hydrolase family 25 [Pseudoscardovia radai]|uniref:Glycosyl hydrolase family 25 n=1 Tax=Pseudoscardovia radai TaxID=987066 RepID=A0A261EXX6_9BIFI|nr:GH25 family lysozyme [Pseudoscardovia radai]OZG51714.1 glycosyl hydrolase family 25 [Pseudoscardovia radai]